MSFRRDAVLLTLTVLGLPALARGSDDAPPTILQAVHVTWQDRPMAGSTVYAGPSSYAKGPARKPPAARTDAAGLAHVLVPTDDGPGRGVSFFAHDDAGHVGFADLYSVSAAGAFDVPLRESATVTGRFFTPEGRPAVGVRVTVYRIEQRAPSGGELPLSFNMPDWLAPEFAATSGPDGQVALPRLSTESLVQLKFTSPAFGEGNLTVTAGLPFEMRLAPTGTLHLRFGATPAADTRGLHWYFWKRLPPTHLKNVTSASCSRQGTCDGSDPYVIKHIPEGDGTLSLYGSLTTPVTPTEANKVTVPGGATTELTVPLTRTALLTGRIIDKATGQGLAGVPIAAAKIVRRNSVSPLGTPVQTDKEGRYQLHVPANVEVTTYLQYGTLTPRFVPKTGREPLPPTYKLAPGAHQTAPDITLERTVTLQGQVVSADGKPAAGALVLTPFLGETTLTRQSDRQGKFTLPGFPPDPDVRSPRVRLGNAVNQPQLLDLTQSPEPLQIILNDRWAAHFKGRVTDQAGRPLAGTRVGISWSARGAGRFYETSTNVPADQPITDAEGNFLSGGLWPNDEYQITVTARGYSRHETTWIKLDGKTHDLGVLRLTRTAATVTGRVVDSAGKPLAGVEVLNQGDGPTAVSARTDAAGRFTLGGYYENAGFVFARHAGYRTAFTPAQPDGPAVTVTLRRRDEPPSYVPSRGDADRRVEADLTRFLLDGLWQARKPLGGGGNALRAMAQFDPDTAKKWDEEDRKATGRSQPSHLLVEARARTLLTDSRQDVEEALEALQGAEPSAAAHLLYEAGESLVGQDNPRALRLAEELAVRARGLKGAHLIWSLAQAGGLARAAGNTEGGKKLLLEAADLAAKTSTEGLNDLARGITARYLALVDLDRAKQLIEPLPPDSFNRYLRGIIYELAPSRYETAKELLGTLKKSDADYAATTPVLLACRIAATRPDEADRLVESIDGRDDAYRIMALGRLARALAPHDPPRAHRLLDKALSLLDQSRDGLNSRGGTCVHAAVLALDAKECGHPDVGTFVTAALMHRPASPYDARGRDEQLLQLAMVLSFLDPALARHVLAGVAPRGQFIDRALHERREWLFALALADPPAAKTLVEKKLALVRERPNELSNTGLLELATILTEPRRGQRGQLFSFSSIWILPTEPD